MMAFFGQSSPPHSFWPWCAQKGNQLLNYLTKLRDPKEFVSALVIMLLLIGSSILLFKILNMAKNTIDLYLIKYRARAFWKENSEKESIPTNRYQLFASKLLGHRFDDDGDESPQRLPQPPWWAFWEGQLIRGYIYGLYHIRHINGSYDRESLSEIFEEKLDRWVEIPRYMAASFILLGLFGTVLGLSRSMEQIIPLIRTRTEQRLDLQSLQEIVGVLLGTVRSMEIALHTTVIGLAGTLILSVLLVIYKQLTGYFVTNSEEFIHTQVIPALFPEEQSQIKEHLSSILKQNEKMVKHLQYQAQTANEHLKAFRQHINEEVEKYKNLHEVLSASQHSLKQIEGAFDKRFDQQLQALDRLLAQTHAAQERLYQGGSQLMGFVDSFEESIEKQVDASKQIQSAQIEFNDIIAGYRDIMRQISDESKKTLESVGKQQAHLEQILSQEKHLVKIMQDEKKQLDEHRQRLEKKQEASQKELQQEFFNQLSTLKETVHQSRDTLTHGILQQGEALQGVLREKIQTAGQELAETIKQTYSEAPATLKDLAAHNTKLQKQTASLLQEIQTHHSDLKDTYQTTSENINTHFSKLHEEQQALHASHIEIVKELQQATQQQQSFQQAIQQQQILLVNQHKEHRDLTDQKTQDMDDQWQRFLMENKEVMSEQRDILSRSFVQKQEAIDAFQQEIKKGFSPLNSLPALLSEQEQTLQSIRSLLQSAETLQKVPQILEQISPLATLPETIRQLQQLLGRSLQGVQEALRHTQSPGVHLQNEQEWHRIFEQHLTELKHLREQIIKSQHQLQEHFKQSQESMQHQLKENQRNLVSRLIDREKRSGFFGWFRR